MLMPGDRSGRYGNRNRVVDDATLTELHGDLRALYEMYRRGEVPERVLRLVHQLEDAYWGARLAESGEEKTAKNDEPTPNRRSN